MKEPKTWTGKALIYLRYFNVQYLNIQKHKIQLITLELFLMNVQSKKLAIKKNGTAQIYFKYKNVNYFKSKNTLPHTWPNYPLNAQVPTTKLKTESTSES